ncbi:MAG: hypothetical protein ACFFB5_16790 [Promethearchaeota archaeon]
MTFLTSLVPEDPSSIFYHIKFFSAIIFYIGTIILVWPIIERVNRPFKERERRKKEEEEIKRLLYEFQHPIKNDVEGSDDWLKRE